ncbi:MAG: hypothetical protein FD143_3115, partial [Ignavibacteria bacterium]
LILRKNHYFFTSWKPGKERDQFDYYYHKEKVMNRIKYARGEIGGLKSCFQKSSATNYYYIDVFESF